MSTLEETLQTDLIAAAKARDEVKLQVLRLLKAALQNYSIEIKGELSPQQVLQVLQKAAKQRQDSIEQYAKAGRTDLVDQETTELKILSAYLPAQPSETDVEAAVKAAIAEVKDGQANLGQIIATVREHFDGVVDSALVAKLAREELSR